MPTCVHVVLSDAEYESFHEAAEREGLAVSSWLRAAGNAAARANRRPLRTVDDLRAFFDAIDRAQDVGAEPDWPEHLETIQKSVSGGWAPT